MNERFVVIDLETTGNAPQKGDRIIQIGMIVIENRQIVERFSSFVNPECNIPLFIQQLTQIDEQMVKEAPVFAELAPEIAAKLKQSYFVAHNVAFDWPFLQAELQLAGISLPTPPMIDTVELSRLLFPTFESYKLSDLAQTLNIAHENPHQADSGAEVTAKLWLRLLEKLRSLPLATLEQLKRLSRDWKSDMYAMLDAMIAKKMTLREEEGYVYYRGIALKKRVDVTPKKQETPFSFTTWLAERSPLPFPHYEHRDGQWEMMKLVHEALQTSQHALIEAGTGIGKSLAYLIPSLYVARKQQKPVVISTYTLHLQKQLIERDVPLLQQIVPFPFRVALLKGRRNYLSLDKFVSFLHKRSARKPLPLGMGRNCYDQQVKVMVPRDLPSISAVSLEEYAEAVASQLLTISTNVNGKILVLFTSYELLRMTAAMVKERNDDETFVLLVQGGEGGSTAKLTKAFQQFERAMLFGTSSFWEGVDLPGDALSFVVIVRLPFAPPDDPVMEAKSDYIRAKGGNPFYDLSLPQAVIRFKQGFGRLIRTKEDRGVLFVLDRRLLTASYGKYFLASLPGVPVYDEPLEQLLQKI